MTKANATRASKFVFVQFNAFSSECLIRYSVDWLITCIWYIRPWILGFVTHQKGGDHNRLCRSSSVTCHRISQKTLHMHNRLWYFPAGGVRQTWKHQNYILKKLALAFVFLLSSNFIWASFVYIPMNNNTQNNHLKAYGIVYFSLQSGLKAKWLLNYDGGAFLIENNTLI